MKRCLAHVAAFALLVALAPPAAAASPQQELVDKAALTVEKMVGDQKLTSLRAALKNAKAVLVVPSMIKGGFIVGAEGGNGVLLARDAHGGWSNPAFYTLGAGSIGLQAGVQDSEIMLVIVTEKGLNAVLDRSFKLGADASVAAGPIGGAGVSAATTAGLGADIYSFSDTHGAFAGVSLDGTAVVPRASWNKAYYGKATEPRAILIRRQLTNQGADRLRRALTGK